MKNVEKPKYRPSDIIAEVAKKGFLGFSMHSHTTLWKENDARNPDKQYGVEVGKTWYWYKKWLDFVITHCEQNR